jgi:hypothetical protein
MVLSKLHCPKIASYYAKHFAYQSKTKWYKWFCLKMSCRNLHYFPDADGHKWHTHMSCWSKYSPWFYYIQVLGPPLPWSMVSLSPNPRVLWVGVGRGCISSVLMVSPLPPWGVGWGGCRMEHKIAGAWEIKEWSANINSICAIRVCNLRVVPAHL